MFGGKRDNRKPDPFKTKSQLMTALPPSLPAENDGAAKPMDRNLTAEEQVTIALRRITRAADIHSHLVQRDFGVTGPQLSTLRVIRRLQPVATSALWRVFAILLLVTGGFAVGFNVGHLWSWSRFSRDDFWRHADIGWLAIGQSAKSKVDRAASRLGAPVE
jgi:hypothetical protein